MCEHFYHTMSSMYNNIIVVSVLISNRCYTFGRTSCRTPLDLLSGTACLVRHFEHHSLACPCLVKASCQEKSSYTSTCCTNAKNARSPYENIALYIHWFIYDHLTKLSRRWRQVHDMLTSGLNNSTCHPYMCSLLMWMSLVQKFSYPSWVDVTFVASWTYNVNVCSSLSDNDNLEFATRHKLVRHLQLRTMEPESSSQHVLTQSQSHTW